MPQAIADVKASQTVLNPPLQMSKLRLRKVKKHPLFVIQAQVCDHGVGVLCAATYSGPYACYFHTPLSHSFPPKKEIGDD